MENLFLKGGLIINLKANPNRLFSRVNLGFTKLISSNKLVNPKSSIWVQTVTADELPDQGFKLHISATTANAMQIAQIVLPFLLKNQVCFKMVKNLNVLDKLNKGIYGLSQIGKFITIYPKNNEHLILISKRLKELLKGFDGPVIISDNHLGGPLYYRYGSFSIAETIILPNGEVIEDDRLPGSAVPDGIVDPFQRKKQLNKLALPKRYTVIEVLRKRGKGSVYRILDLHSKPIYTRILKGASKLGEMEITGIDALDRLHWEARLAIELSQFGNSYPDVHDQFHIGEDLYVVFTDMGQDSLMKKIEERTFHFLEVLDLGIQLCRIVQTAHMRNIVLRDLSLDNLIIKNHRLSIIDLEHAYREDGPPIVSIGSAGFSLYRQMNSTLQPLKPLFSHDIYSIGAILYTLLSPQKYIDFIIDYRIHEPDKREISTAWERGEIPVEVPGQLRSVLIKSISSNPKFRFRKLDTLLSALEDIKMKIHENLGDDYND